MNIKCDATGSLTEPCQLDSEYVDAVTGCETFSSNNVITAQEHELLMEQGFVEYDRLWKELADA